MKKYGIALVAIIVPVGMLFNAGVLSPHKAKTTPPIEVKWLIAHQPTWLFNGAAQAFETEFNNDSDGTVQIQILGPKDFGSNNGHLSYTQVASALNSGQVQLATTVVGSLAASTTPEVGILNLPFLFNEYHSAGKALNGSAAQQLLQNINDTTPYHGLAFTFSGGLMVIESNKKQIQSAADFKGLNIGTVNGPISEQTLRAFGATPVAIDSRVGAKATSEALQYLDGIETPYTRIATSTGQGVVPKYVSETDHSFFLTVILASDGFYNSLSPRNQIALRKASQAAALVERADSEALAAQQRQALQKAGTLISTLSPQATADLKNLSQSVYTTFETTFGDNLVQEILKERQ